MSGGVFLSAFREYVTWELKGDDRFIPVRSVGGDHWGRLTRVDAARRPVPNNGIKLMPAELRRLEGLWPQRAATTASCQPDNLP